MNFSLILCLLSDYTVSLSLTLKPSTASDLHPTLSDTDPNVTPSLTPDIILPSHNPAFTTDTNLALCLPLALPLLPPIRTGPNSRQAGYLEETWAGGGGRRIGTDTGTGRPSSMACRMVGRGSRLSRVAW